MDRISKIIIIFGVFFVTVFFLSFFMPDAKITNHSQWNDDQAALAQGDDEQNVEEDTQNQNLNSGQKMEQQIQNEQNKYYRSLQQDESAYYKEASPEANEAPDYFMQDHPLDEQPLEENQVR